jgi:hypothetical protein
MRPLRERLWDIVGAPQGTFWDVVRLPMGRPWNIVGLLMRGPRNIVWLPMGRFWAARGSIMRLSMRRPSVVRRLIVGWSMRRPVVGWMMRWMVRRGEAADGDTMVWSSPVRGPRMWVRARVRVCTVPLSRFVTTSVVTMLAVTMVVMVVAVPTRDLMVNLAKSTAHLVVNGLEDAFPALAGSDAVYKIGAVSSDGLPLLLNQMFEESQLPDHMAELSELQLKLIIRILGVIDWLPVKWLLIEGSKCFWTRMLIGISPANGDMLHLRDADLRKLHNEPERLVTWHGQVNDAGDKKIQKLKLSSVRRT